MNALERMVALQREGAERCRKAWHLQAELLKLDDMSMELEGK